MGNYDNYGSSYDPGPTILFFFALVAPSAKGKNLLCGNRRWLAEDRESRVQSMSMRLHITAKYGHLDSHGGTGLLHIPPGAPAVSTLPSSLFYTKSHSTFLNDETDISVPQ